MDPTVRTPRTRCGAALGIASAVLVIVVLAAASPAKASSPSPSEWVIGPPKHVVLITFGGRPSSHHLRRVLHTLVRKHAHASFFLPGRWIAHHKRLVRKVHRASNAFGNRGYGPRAFVRMSDARVRSSIARAQRVLNRVGVTPRPFLRLPHGARDLRVLRDAAAMGYRSVRWTEHPGGGTVREVKRQVMTRVHNGSIISLDVRRWSHRRALSAIIHALRKRRFRLVKLGVLNHVHAVNWSATLGLGSAGRGVHALERALHRGSYPAGHVDGRFGYEDQQAVIAYEKVHRIHRDGLVPPLEFEAIAADPRPTAPRHHRRRFVDIDISRQVLFEVKHRKVIHTLPVSTGGEYVYVSGGQTFRAHTPRGRFSIFWKVAGWRNGSLGRLWYPNYFVGGFAIHGYPEVPVQPVSHGCVRIPMYAAKPFFYREPLGVRVFVHN
jgi:N-acetylmuramoyl-L-alanine amidase